MKTPYSTNLRTGWARAGFRLLPAVHPESGTCPAEPGFCSGDGHPARCPLCLGSPPKILSRYREKSLNQCLACGITFVLPQPSPSDVAAHFQNDPDVDDLHRWFERNRERVLARVAKQIQSRKEQGKILDVGCATGLFLARFFPASRWETWAVELSPRKAQAAARNGICVQVGDIHRARFDECSFDVITVLDAFYYFPDPQSELRELHRILRNNGLLVLELPWAGSRIWRRSRILCWLLRDRQVPLLESSDHLFYYTPKSIGQLLHHSGFAVRTILPLPGNRQETMFRDLLYRGYSFFSMLLHTLSGSKCFLGPRFLVVAEKRLAETSGDGPSPLSRIQ